MREYPVSEAIHRISFVTRVSLGIGFLFVQFVDWTVPRNRAYVGMIGIAIIIMVHRWFRKVVHYVWRFDAALLERQAEEENDKLEIGRVDLLLSRSDDELRKSTDVVIIITDGQLYMPVKLYQIHPSEVRKILTKTRGDILERQALRVWPKEPEWVTWWRKRL